MYVIKVRINWKDCMNIKKGIIFLLIILTTLTSCVNQKAITAEKQAGAYYTIFKTLYEIDAGLNAGSKYLVLDLTKVKLTDTDPLVALIQSFCDDNGYDLILDTLDGLIEKGYVVNLIFFEGFLFVFDDIQLDNNTLYTKARKWRTGTGAVGADYTVKLKGGSWEITKTENYWVS